MQLFLILRSERYFCRWLVETGPWVISPGGSYPQHPDKKCMFPRFYPCSEVRASLVVRSVKNLPVRQESRVWSLGWEDPLEKEMATHSRILAWRIPRTEEPSGLQSMGSQSLASLREPPPLESQKDTEISRESQSQGNFFPRIKKYRGQAKLIWMWLFSLAKKGQKAWRWDWSGGAWAVPLSPPLPPQPHPFLGWNAGLKDPGTQL